MTSHAKPHSISVIVLLLFLVNSHTVLSQANYQDQTAGPPIDATAPVELGFIDLSNGNLHLEIPLASAAQRGTLGYSARLTYDSRIWTNSTFGPAYQGTFQPNNILPSLGGWRLVVDTDVTSTVADYVDAGGPCGDPFQFTDGNFSRPEQFYWKSPEGITHTWQNLYTNEEFGPHICDDIGTNISTTSGYADDGSGFFLIVTNYRDMTVYAPDGRQVYPQFKDDNGNYFSNDPNNNVIDTLGRVPVVQTKSGSNILYDVLNAQGGRSRFTVTTTSINVSVPNYSGTLTVIQSITLPNNTSYAFSYESGTDGNSWGGVTGVTLPAGSEISYGYTTFADAWNLANRWVTSRSSGGSTWHYTPLVTNPYTCCGQPASGCCDQQITVAEPNGDYTIYKSHSACFQFAFPLKERDVYSATGVLLQQELIERTPDTCTVAGDEQEPIEVAALPARVTTITTGPSGNTLTSKVDYNYTNSPSIGNPTKISEWNFYSGTAPATPDRVRQITYSIANPTLAGAHITAKPLTVTLEDGAGNQIAQTSFTYDKYDDANPLVSTGECQTTSASQSSPAAPQHDYLNYCTSNTVRGNLTEVTKWLNTAGTSITTATNSYDDTGNLLTTKDALLNPTTMEYASSFGRAYPTTITNALNQVTTKNYDFNTGLLISETDPNGQTTGLQTKYTYDNMGRLIQTDFPDGGQSKTSFNNDAIPFTVTTTQLATPDPSIVRYTVFDGLGRAQNECLADPEGDDCTDSGYDQNGRLNSKSNPHRPSAAATDGVAFFGYDGLDRSTSVTETDANVVLTSYDVQISPVAGTATTMKDETGRQRRTVTDAFGRLVEADEPGDAFAGTQAYSSIDIGAIKTTIVGGSPAVQAKGTVTISTSTNGEQCSSDSGGTGGCIRQPSGGLICSKVDHPWFRYLMTPPAPAALQTICDTGNIVVTINGTQYKTSWQSGSNLTSIANALVSAITSPSVTAAVTSTSATSATITLTAVTAGSAANSITLSTSYSNDSADFGTPSFTSSVSGPSLTGGADAVAGTSVTDHGTVTMTVGTFTTASVSYGPGTANTTGAAVASALASALAGSGFSGQTSGTVNTVTDNTVGTAGNAISVSIHPTSGDPTDFPSPSFSVSPVALANGQDPYPSGLAHPYVTRYFYDLLDNLTCVEQHGNTTGSDCSPYIMPISSNGPPAADATSPWRIRRFAYDSLSRLRWSNDPESGLTTNTYDNNGNLTTETDARGVIINYSPTGNLIDPLNRVTKITYSDGTPNVTYTYDVSCCGVTSLNPIGRMVSAVAGNTELVFSYDPMGRIKTQWDCPPSGIARGYCYVISTLYDLAGQPTSLTYPDGRTITDSYNAAGHMTGVTLQRFGNTAVNAPYYTVPQSTLPSSWGYWPSGAMNRGIFGNGVIETSGYGPRLQLNAISDAKGTSTLLNRSYGLYDSASHNNGNILSITDVLNSGMSQTYSYDSLNRLLTGAQADNSFNVTYSYDPWGNMKQSGTSNFNPIYDLHNRIQPAPAGCTSATLYCYDASGNLLNDGFHQYSYDGEGRMKTVDSSAAAYTYNAAAHRVRKDTSTASTEYFFFGGHVIAQLNPASSSWTDYVYGYGKRIAQDTSSDGTGAQYFHSDHIGSTRLVTDSAGNSLWQATYDPFGYELSVQDTAVIFQFAGMQYDLESSLYHTDFRQYSSAEGRWLTPDPSGAKAADPKNPQSWNLYAYVLNNPISHADPTGLDPCDPGGGTVVASRLSDGFAEEIAPQGEEPCPLPPLPPPAPADIDPCQGKGDDCYKQELADSKAGGLAIHDPSCLLASLRDVVASGETPNEPDNGYGTVVGGVVIAAPPPFSDLVGTRNAHISNPSGLTAHPNILVEVHRGLRSTAFGRYQINVGTAAELNMTNFSPAGQDGAADRLLRSTGAVRDASRGDIQSAFARAGQRWASMPGAPYGQPTLSLARAVQSFLQAAAGCGSGR